MLTKVISGCQTGVDEAGLAAAYDYGIQTGGYIPKGHKTLKGPRPDLTKKYGLIEHSSSGYKERTWDNVQSSDGTLRFASNWKSSGEICTKNAIINYNKPYCDISIPDGLDDTKFVLQWINDNNIKVLNIAGNSEQTSPGIYKITYEFLMKLFKELKNEELRSKS